MKILMQLMMIAAFVMVAGMCVAQERVYFENGNPINMRVRSGDWSRSGDYYQGKGTGAAVDLGDVITSGDFRLEMVLRGNSYASNPGFVQINELGELGFVRSASDQKLYQRGFFFGDITRSLVTRSSVINNDEDFELVISRTGDMVRFTLNGQVVTSMPYEGERPFGKVSIANSNGRLLIRSARLVSGDVAPLSSWQGLRAIEHDQPGQQVDVFSRGSGGYHTYRIPALEMAGAGVLLAFCEGRRNSASDSGDIDLLVKRSLDGGLTWGPASVVYSEPGNVTIGNPVPVYDANTDTMWLAFCRNNNRVFITKSQDNGETWDTPRDITADVKKPGTSWYATGPGHGLITTAGRIVIPANHGSTAHTFYSDDDGVTWTLGGDIDGYGNEVTVAETSDHRLYINTRNAYGTYARRSAYSSNRGVTWQPGQTRPDLVEPGCQGSVRSVTLENGVHVMLFSNPASARRERLTVKLSQDNGVTWTEGQRLYEGSAAYSDLVYLGDGWFGCIYERDWYDHLTFARFHISWLDGSAVRTWSGYE